MSEDVYIEKIAVNKHSVNDLQEFYQKHLKNKSFEAYKVETGWEDLCDAVNTSYSLVFSNLSNAIRTEGIRQALDLSYFTNAHAYERQMTDGFSIDYIKLDADNNYQDLIDRFEAERRSYEGLNSSSDIYTIWYLTYHIDIENRKAVIDAYCLTSKASVNKVLTAFSKYRQEELNIEKKKKEAEKADQDLNNIIKSISKMSVKNKQKVLQALVK